MPVGYVGDSECWLETGFSRITFVESERDPEYCKGNQPKREVREPPPLPSSYSTYTFMCAAYFFFTLAISTFRVLLKRALSP